MLNLQIWRSDAVLAQCANLMNTPLVLNSHCHRIRMKTPSKNRRFSSSSYVSKLKLPSAAVVDDGKREWDLSEALHLLLSDLGLLEMGVSRNRGPNIAPNYSCPQKGPPNFMETPRYCPELRQKAWSPSLLCRPRLAK